ncbi:hypothetical protein D9611_001973 [Ephemerocybe angulata]|uniref:Uncharacterized protein n=1 Tax=Ephemerocybe angulata TaxID=980116 RepID=A0A8H5FMF1_9AGAR|nr:hypothetical protein D9611_001973 [Tulosesus angulatus]
MATRNPIQPQAAQATQLCDYCHLKPKFSNHAYCSKTCGTQAALLCNYCHKKPKFQNFEFCGKNCANLAYPGGKPPAPAAGLRGPAGQQPKGKAAPNPAQAQPFGGALDPLSIAKMVVQQMPQLQGLLNGSGGAANPQYQQPGPALNPSSNNPFINSGAAQAPKAQGQPTNGNAQAAYYSSTSNGVNYGVAPPPPSGAGGLGLSSVGGGAAGGYQQPQPDAEDLECLIPGCGKPAHVDAKGMKTSDYCSQRHREEAVATGLASPCIMCMTKPQSHTDYFCSRTCREESLNKPYELPAATIEPADEEEDEE